MSQRDNSSRTEGGRRSATDIKTPTLDSTAYAPSTTDETIDIGSQDNVVGANPLLESLSTDALNLRWPSTDQGGSKSHWGAVTCQSDEGLMNRLETPPLYLPKPAVSGKVEPNLPHQLKTQHELIVTGQKLNFLRVSDDNPKGISAFPRYLRKRYLDTSPEDITDRGVENCG